MGQIRDKCGTNEDEKLGDRLVRVNIESCNSRVEVSQRWVRGYSVIWWGWWITNRISNSMVRVSVRVRVRGLVG